MYYSISQLHRISRLCIVAVLKFVINQHFFPPSILVVFLITCHLLFSLFFNAHFVHLPVTIVEGGIIQNYENYAIPSFAYVGSAYRCVNY